MAKRIARESQNSYTVKLKSDKPLAKPVIIRRKGKPIGAFVPLKDYERYVAWRKSQPRSRVAARNRATTRKTGAWVEEQKNLLARDVAAYNEMKAELVRTSKNKWVAILDGKLVDMAGDEKTLIDRVYAKFGDRTMLIRQVTATERVYHVNSPRVVRQ